MRRPSSPSSVSTCQVNFGEKMKSFPCKGHSHGTKIPNCALPSFQIPVFLVFVLWLVPSSSISNFKPPPLPILPIPNAFQLQWQLSNMAMFLHFGLNTFNDSEWGTGHTDPNFFNPMRLNATQWVQVAKECGFSRVILTVKHHDGFCLWPSEYTDYSVRSSSKWRNGTGDVIAELASAAKDAGIGLGLYLSPWDRHEPSYGKTLEYNEYYMAQMTELLTRYGEIKDVFLDGAKGEAPDMEYFFDSWFSLIHQLQPGAIIFSDAGPDTRWIGDEAGVAGSSCWSLLNRSACQIGGSDTQYLIGGDPVGVDWVPGTCDTSIRPGWFWHASEVPKSAKNLLDMYYTSAGRNCHLLLNVPPNSSGLISDEDIQVLREFSELRRSIFSLNLATHALLNASSTRGGTGFSRFSPYNVLEESIYTYWAPEENQSAWILYIDLQESVSFNVLQLQEPIQMGQRVIEFHLETLNESVWKRVINGTTIGYRRLLRFPKLTSQHLKLVIDKSRADPLVSFVGLHMDQFSIFSDISYQYSPHFNGSQVLHSASPNNSQSATI